MFIAESLGHTPPFSHPIHHLQSHHTHLFLYCVHLVCTVFGMTLGQYMQHRYHPQPNLMEKWVKVCGWLLGMVLQTDSTSAQPGIFLWATMPSVTLLCQPCHLLWRPLDEGFTVLICTLAS